MIFHTLERSRHAFSVSSNQFKSSNVATIKVIGRIENFRFGDQPLYRWRSWNLWRSNIYLKEKKNGNRIDYREWIRRYMFKNLKYRKEGSMALDWKKMYSTWALNGMEWLEMYLCWMHTLAWKKGCLSSYLKASSLILVKLKYIMSWNVVWKLVKQHGYVSSPLNALTSWDWK